MRSDYINKAEEIMERFEREREMEEEYAKIYGC